MSKLCVSEDEALKQLIIIKIILKVVNLHMIHQHINYRRMENIT